MPFIMSFICTKQPKNSFFPDLRKGTNFNPLIAKPHKTVKHIQTISRKINTVAKVHTLSDALTF